VYLATFVGEVTLMSVITVAMRSARIAAVQAQGALRRENRAHRAVTTCNEVVARAKDEHEMLHKICTALVDVGGYRMCWIGMAQDDEGRSVTPVAHAGVEEGYLEQARITWADDPRGHGPTGMAIRTGHPSVQQDVTADPAFLPWREDALRRGYAASIALPLRVDERVIGAMMIYSSEPGSFDEEEVRLLAELADDAAYGISAMRARALAAESRRAKDEFLRVVSHELRTPLTPVIGWAQALARYNGRGNGIVARGLDVILRSARRQAKLVDDVLAVSRFASGEADIERARVDLGAITADCVEEVRPEAEAKGIGLEQTIASGVSTRGDALQLRRAIQNVIANALKFTARGGRVSVDVARERDGSLVIVRDTGRGVAPSELPHLFEFFRSGDRSTTRAEGGLGAGLFLVRAIVEAHGGRVHAESPGVGRGTTLVLTLPGS
jgi:signal transduction histidine kinase